MKPYHIDSDLTYKNSISQNSISKHMYFYLDYKHLKALDVLVLAGGYPVRQKGNGMEVINHFNSVIFGYFLAFLTLIPHQKR